MWYNQRVKIHTVHESHRLPFVGGFCHALQWSILLSIVGLFVMKEYMKGVLQDGRTEECKA